MVDLSNLVDIPLHETMKAAGFRWAVVVQADVSVLEVGASVAFFRIWCSSEDAYLAEINGIYRLRWFAPDGTFAKVEL